MAYLNCIMACQHYDPNITPYNCLKSSFTYSAANITHIICTLLEESRWNRKRELIVAQNYCATLELFVSCFLFRTFCFLILCDNKFPRISVLEFSATINSATFDSHDIFFPPFLYFQMQEFCKNMHENLEDILKSRVQNAGHQIPATFSLMIFRDIKFPRQLILKFCAISNFRNFQFRKLHDIAAFCSRDFFS